eukprot:TRINITY_DN70118_c0_g1_i1.p1 TRINITY_DN70118_c0_g1~~TRINITY_DN70118_c0_g1_i1.p1  ORF type:complete len:121 (+),score=15.01 TRINITY_DN70118_c0_g1_i1:102-464(+)
MVSSCVADEVEQGLVKPARSVANSVIVDDLHFDGTRGGPFEASAPLFVDADAVLSLAVAGQCFQSVLRRNAQIAENDSGIQHGQLSHRDGLNIHPASNPAALEQLASLFAFEALDCHEDE